MRRQCEKRGRPKRKGVYQSTIPEFRLAYKRVVLYSIVFAKTDRQPGQPTVDRVLYAHKEPEEKRILAHGNGT